MIKPILCQDKSDAELVILTEENKEYFVCLMNRYEQRLLAYIMRLFNFKREEAEDVLQETFIKAFYKLRDFDRKLKFSAWIYRIAHNETINFLRKRKSNIFVSLSEDEWLNIASEVNIKREVAQKFDHDKTRQLISKLEPKYQDVLVLKFLEGYDYQEISDILKKPMGTVATLINRAKNKLKQELIENKIYE